MTIKVLVWGENLHENSHAEVRSLYPDGMHSCIANSLNQCSHLSASTATLQEPEHGLSEQRLADTDVLLWWGHAAHADVVDEIVDRVQERVWQGMGLIVLHSAHFSKIFKRLMGSPCSLVWREAGEKERIWSINPSHPICDGIDDWFELPQSEMYGEPFVVPEPMETLFISWFAGGEVFRSGMTWQRGAGRIFYFAPGHETYPIYHDINVQRILTNATCWLANPAPVRSDIQLAPNRPIDQALEPLEQRGASLHKPGEKGFS
ncbi:MAG: ThuA domain-containing protein [Granulosicoccus sp.]|nr:ThuA domain-containing protein [Granulosicoccus sp.]